tara:strand:+ start:183 stop:1253 length:1071 start_codon:yes stop_codon:yes gene_type:complete
MKVFSNLILTLISIFIPLTLTDIYFKLNKFPADSGRVMLLSGGSLSSEKSGIRQYTANKTLRNSAVYGNILEYSYFFKTDINGFRITNQCKKRTPKGIIAIAGDSYTEGQGSSIVWTKNIQKDFCNKGYNSVNTAIGGNSIVEMKNALIYARTNLGSKKAIIAIIQDDIYRPFVPMVSNKICSQYVNKKNNKCGVSATWWHHPIDFDQEQLVSFANTKYSFGLLSVTKKFINHLKIEIKNKFPNIYTNTKENSIKKNLSALNEVLEEYGEENTIIILLPTKSDLDLNVPMSIKEIKSSYLKKFLNGINKKVKVIDIRNCKLEKKHFHLLDGHPNENGQKLLGECAARKFTIFSYNW